MHDSMIYQVYFKNYKLGVITMQEISEEELGNFKNLVRIYKEKQLMNMLKMLQTIKKLLII